MLNSWLMAWFEITTTVTRAYTLCQGRTWGALDLEFRCLPATRCSFLQAMADYAELITALKTELDAEGAAVIGFGGSYGAPGNFAIL